MAFSISKHANVKITHTSWYFLVTFVGTHWHSLQLCWQQAQFPPHRFTRRHRGQKMVSVLFSSSRSDTEKLRGVQLYSRASSFRRFRSTTEKRRKTALSWFAIPAHLGTINFSSEEPMGNARFCAGSAQNYNAAVP